MVGLVGVVVGVVFCGYLLCELCVAVMCVLCELCLFGMCVLCELCLFYLHL